MDAEENFQFWNEKRKHCLRQISNFRAYNENNDVDKTRELLFSLEKRLKVARNHKNLLNAHQA